jgi:hypothetical protein
LLTFQSVDISPAKEKGVLPMLAVVACFRLVLLHLEKGMAYHFAGTQVAEDVDLDMASTPWCLK